MTKPDSQTQENQCRISHTRFQRKAPSHESALYLLSDPVYPLPRRNAHRDRADERKEHEPLRRALPALPTCKFDLPPAYGVVLSELAGGRQTDACDPGGHVSGWYGARIRHPEDRTAPQGHEDCGGPQEASWQTNSQGCCKETCGEEACCRQEDGHKSQTGRQKGTGKSQEKEI